MAAKGMSVNGNNKKVTVAVKMFLLITNFFLDLKWFRENRFYPCHSDFMNVSLLETVNKSLLKEDEFPYNLVTKPF